MRRKKTLAALAAIALLCGCAAPAPAEPDASSAPAAEEAPAPAQERLPAGEDAGEWTLADFPGCFAGDWDTAREEYALGEGLSVTVLRGGGEGPTLYLVAGLHGDETAGWRAGALLKSADLKAGTLYIVSPANPYGAAHDQRKTREERDINRNFPGDAAGCDAARIAAAIYGDMQEKQPALLLDLHEARSAEDGRDALGNSLICQSLDGIGDLVWEMLLASEDGTLGSAALTLYGAPPEGSINRTVTENLGIPVITVETLRTEPLARRVCSHLEVAQYVLMYYGML